jgi:hypothetical protein
MQSTDIQTNPAPESSRADGFPAYIHWRGKRYQTPSTSEIENWVFDSVCDTPEGDTVEPDHPDSWLSILGLI